MTDYIVKPTIVDGIEFYVSPTGEAGMSVRGLARLCGIAESTLRGKLGGARKNKTESSETLTSSKFENFEVREYPFSASTNARILTAESCAEIISHYALKENKPEALYSLGKFAKIGISSWIHQVTGYAQAQDLNKLAETMNLLLQEIKELRVETREYKQIRRQNDLYFNGLNDLMEDIAATDVNLLPAGDSDGRYTITEWLQTKGISLEKDQLHRLANLAAFTYRTMTKKNPTIVYRHSTQATKTKKVNGYLEQEFPILNIALTKLLQP